MAEFLSTGVKRAIAVGALCFISYYGSLVMITGSNIGSGIETFTHRVARRQTCRRHGAVEIRRAGVPNAPVHDGPGYSYKITKKLPYSTPVEVLGYNSNIWEHYSEQEPPAKIHDLRRESYSKRGWEKIALENDEEEGWIFNMHTMSYYGGPDRELEWDTERPDKILNFFSANRLLRLERKPGRINSDVASYLTYNMMDLIFYNDKRAIPYIESIMSVNLKQADIVNYYVVYDGISVLSYISNRRSIPMLYKTLVSYDGEWNDSIRENAARTILGIVEREGGDFNGYARMAATEILTDRKYTAECRTSARKIISALKGKN